MHSNGKRSKTNKPNPAHWHQILCIMWIDRTQPYPSWTHRYRNQHRWPPNQITLSLPPSSVSNFHSKSRTEQKKKSDFDQKKEKKQIEERITCCRSHRSCCMEWLTLSSIRRVKKKIRHLFFSESSHNSSNNFCWCNNERIKYKMLSGNSNFKLRSDVWHFVSKSTE